MGSLKLSELQSGQIFVYRMNSEIFLILDFQLGNGFFQEKLFKIISRAISRFLCMIMEHSKIHQLNDFSNFQKFTD